MDQWVVENPRDLAATFLEQHKAGGYKLYIQHKFGEYDLLPAHEFDAVKCSLHDSFNKKHCISKAFDTNYENQQRAEIQGQQKALNDLVDSMADLKD